MRNSLVSTFCEEAKNNQDLVFVTADLGYNVLTKIIEEYPNQYINVGICEQNMTSVAAGLALSGKCVFTYSIGSFSTLRCLEQIRNDVCYHNANVKIVALAAGFSYGPLGMSHHATEDIGAMRAMPNLTIFSPCDPIETKAVTKAAINIKTPCYIRIGRGGEKNIHEDSSLLEKFVIGKAYQLFDGNDGCIFSTGPITIEAKKAVLKLKERNTHFALYSFPTIKPIDKGIIMECAKKYKKIIVVEEHQIYGGFASAIGDVITESVDAKAILVRIGMRDEFTSIVGDTDYLRKVYKMDCDYIAKRCEEALK